MTYSALAINLLISVYMLVQGLPFTDLWILLYTLQIVCYLDIYDINLPANAQLYNDRITSVIEFDYINPTRYVQLANVKFTLQKWLAGDDVNVDHEDQTVLMLDDMQMPIYITIVVLLVAGVMACIS